MRQIELKLEGVSKTYPGRDGAVQALEDINLEVAEGELVCVVGQSGCGKSTLLQIVAGLEPPTTGRVYAGGRPVTGPDCRRGMVFQGFSLFPWLDVAGNVAFGLKVRGVEDWQERVERILRLVGLDSFRRARPQHLSGGMAQRVALARTLVNEPQVLLLDEPFGALDAFTRMAMQDELVRIWQEAQLTTLFVTHDIDEAIYLGDRVVVLTPRPGRVKRVLDVPLPRPRDRAHPDFFYVRRQVYEEFGLRVEYPETFRI
ncbi:MAG TPA: ABC transporter ATP-binding protein [Anaerolineae bacterium]|nr:ABC transporter ATP-binding protein [Anaerolineae bacterium]